MTCTPNRLLSDDGDELLHGLGVADGLVHLPQILLDLLRLDGVLGEDAARHLFALGGLIDLAGDVGLGGSGLVELAEIKGNLPFVDTLLSSIWRSGLSSSAWVMVSMMLCESSGNGTLMPVARLISRTLRSSTSSTMPSMGLSAP